MTSDWVLELAGYLRDTSICPRCSARLDASVCRNCGAVLHDARAAEVHRASVAAAELLERRRSLVAELSSAAGPGATTAAPAPAGVERRAGAAHGIASSTGRPAGAPRAPGVVPTSASSPPGARSSATVQSVLAVAGAALVAVSAIVFTFLNPDLTDRALRSWIVAGVTVLFLASAWMLRRVGLRFSAEAVGGLGIVFVALDVQAFAAIGATSAQLWSLAGVGAVVSAALLLVLGALLRLRVWVWAGLVGLAGTPALFAAAAGDPWVSVVGSLGVGGLALLAIEAARRLAVRFDGPLVAERATAAAVLGVVSLVVPLQLLLATSGTPVVDRALGSAVALLAVALLAGLAARRVLRRSWSTLAGAFVVAGFAVVAVATEVPASWILAVVPLTAAVGLAALAFVPLPRWLSGAAVLAGAWAVALAAAVPAGLGTAVLLLSAPARPQGLGSIEWLASPAGVAAAAAGAIALSMLLRRAAASPRLARGGLVGGLWIGGLAALGLIAWPGTPIGAQASLGLIVAILLAGLLVLVPRAAAAVTPVRLPLVVTAHGAVVLVAAVGASDRSVIVPVGAASILALAAVARTVPRRARIAHLVVGYAYALLLFAIGMELLGLDTIPVLCLTTSLASLVALAATLVRRVDASSWWAVLAVTSVPFLIGVGSVVAVRSGWTGLSTAVVFVLALTLLVTRRPGLNRLVRSLAALILVPSLAVVVVCLGAEWLLVSASPITLPIIAVIVAVVLPTTGRLGRWLAARGIPTGEVRSARLAIEASALATGAIAVLLALVRSAAGLGTTVVVFLVLGLGAAAAGWVLRRPYAWPVAGASFTGALWSLLALGGVGFGEAYVLPPTLAAALVGALMARRRGAGERADAVPRRLFALSLGLAVASSIVLLVVDGGASGGAAWRAPALLAGGALLLGLARLLPRLRLASIRRATLGAAVLAASAGAIQGVRIGWSFDPAPEPPIWVVLGSAVVAAVLAAVAGRLWATASRWAFAPSLVFLVAGPITAIRHDWASIWVLWGLALALLALVVATAALARRRRVGLPPIWFTFALAWATAVAGWSERELRVEAFSLPLGLALLAAGILWLRPGRAERPSPSSWPAGFVGSWALLGPGIVVTLLPSILATATDPLTWRAILVLALALVAILVGSMRRLAAPFVLGIVVLPLENLVVFAVQIGGPIGATPWWISLATAGAVLLVLAATSERRAAGRGGVVARLRDLR